MSAEWNQHSALDCGEYIGAEVTEMIAGRDVLIAELRQQIEDLQQTVADLREQAEAERPRLRRVMETVE